MRRSALVLTLAALCLAHWHRPALAQPLDAGSGANDVPLINAGFESGRFKDVGNGVSGSAPQGWTAFWVNKPGKRKVPWDPMNDSGILPPEYKPVETKPPYLKPPRVGSGNWASSWFAFWKVMDAGLYEQVAVPPGQKLRFSASAHGWSNSGSGAISGTHANDPYWSDGAGVGSNAFFELADPAWPYRGSSALDDAARNLLFQVGIDPAGGTDALAPSVVWGPGAHIYNVYHEVPAVEAVAQGSTVTVFLRVRNLWGFMHNDVYWDDPVLTLTEDCSRSAPPGNWMGEYFPNTSLSGDPTLVRDDGVGFLSFDWGAGGPGVCGIGIDAFSVRWTRTLYFNAGNYRFTATADDGVRVYVDDRLLVDAWVDQAPKDYSAEVSLGQGNHAIRMEYYENGGGAVARLSWAHLGGNPCLQNVPADHWRGEYFPDPSFGGSPTLVRDDGAAGLSFDWGTGGPSTCGIGSDRFSVRWTRTITFEAGTYRFSATSDDGVRLYVDGQRWIDAWLDQPPKDYTADVALTAGNHTVVMEYYENQGGAVAKVSWIRLGGANPCLQDVPADHWRAEYFPDTNLGGSPTLVRDDGGAGLSFDWGAGGPSTCGIGSDRFSVRWTRTLAFDAGTYRFTATVDDGVRLYVDDQLKIDVWLDQPPKAYSAELPLSAGSHMIRMEYYENGGGAVAKLSWEAFGGPPPPPVTGASKLGAHVLLMNGDVMDLIDAGPSVIKFAGDWGSAGAVKPGTFVVGRQVWDDDAQMLRDRGWTPERAAKLFVDTQVGTYQSNPAIKYWEGPNEPVWGDLDGMRWFAAFEVERMRLMAAMGLKCVIGNFATGTPPMELWPGFLSALSAAKQYGAVLGLHEYSNPWIWWMTGRYQMEPENQVDPRDPSRVEGWTTLRYRQVYRQYLEPAGLGDVPLVITEFGIDPLVNPKPDDVPPVTWKGLSGYWSRHANDATFDYQAQKYPLPPGIAYDGGPAKFYADQLIWYDNEMRKDPYVIGATIFTWGSFGGAWGDFDVTGTEVARRIVQHVRDSH